MELLHHIIGFCHSLDYPNIDSSFMKNKSLYKPHTCLLAFLVLIGCGDTGPARYEVQGVVKYQGKTLPYGAVTFFGEGGSPVVSSEIGPDGSYSLKTEPGVTRVPVVAEPPYEDHAPDLMVEGGVPPGTKRKKGPTVPADYGDMATTELFFRVLEKRRQQVRYRP